MPRRRCRHKSQEPYRSAETVRRVLPALRKLDRYERRATVRRHQAVLNFLDRMKLTTICSCNLAKGSQFYQIGPMACQIYSGANNRLKRRELSPRLPP
jgi:hypothetical protein